MEKLIQSYLSATESFKAQINDQKRSVRLILALRLICFLGAVGLFLFLISAHPYIACSAAGITVILFLILLKRETAVNRRITYLRNRMGINETEIDLLHHRFDKRDEGVEFLDKHHLFSSDLDIFGRRSIFQLLNRTSTTTGRSRLASWLSIPLTDKTEIEKRQETVKELSAALEWCQHFIALGVENKESSRDKQSIQDWLEEADTFSSAYYRVACILLPVLSIASLIGYFTGLIPAWPVWVLIFAQIRETSSRLRLINLVHDRLSRKFDSIEKYAALISHIEAKPFSAKGLKDLQTGLSGAEGRSSECITRLRGLSNMLDARKNIIVAVLLNGLLLWDINILRRIESWRREHRADFLKWIDIISTFDASISLGLYAFNHPDYAYPVVQSEDFCLQAETIGHPLIDPQKLILNNYCITRAGHIDLLTGANMAGKSTFLRTIGVNLCLAMTGAPVCAASLRFTPVLLYTSLRTNDSLQENESFFYAELKRLHLLIQYYEEGKPVFFLLDEILKGTNSKDQHSGSLALCRKILRLGGTGIVATHDVELSILSQEYPQQVNNLCFEITIENDKLNFDYTLRPGVCRTMNASFLMKKMGVID